MGGSGSGGHNAKPTEIKKLQGNAGHRKLSADTEPQPDPGIPEKPKGMPKAASREWDRIVPHLLMLRVLTVVDGKALAAYCDAYAYCEMARKDMAKHGLLVEEPILDKMGEEVGVKLKENPAVNTYAKMSGLMNKFLTQFGLTPASRSKLKIEKPKAVDPMDTFMQGTPKGEPAQADAFADLKDDDLKVQ